MLINILLSQNKVAAFSLTESLSMRNISTLAFSFLTRNTVIIKDKINSLTLVFPQVLSPDAGIARVNNLRAPTSNMEYSNDSAYPDLANHATSS
jgi:hypothetical protein